MTVLCTGVRTQKRVCCSHSDMLIFNKSFGTFLAEVVICWKCVALANVDISIKKVLDSVVFIYSVASPSHECFDSVFVRQLTVMNGLKCWCNYKMGGDLKVANDVIINNHSM